MKIETIEKILKLHYVNTMWVDNRLYAEEEYSINGVGTSTWIDVTDWTRKEVYDWLGY